MWSEANIIVSGMQGRRSTLCPARNANTRSRLFIELSHH